MSALFLVGSKMFLIWVHTGGDKGVDANGKRVHIELNRVRQLGGDIVSAHE